MLAFAWTATLLGCGALFPTGRDGHAEEPAPATREARPQRPPRPSRSGSNPAPLAPAPLPAPTPVSPFALGLNEGVSIPARLVVDMSYPQQAAALAEDAAAVAATGARFVRGHTGAYPAISAFDLARNPDRMRAADTWVAAVQAAGLEPVLMVSPWPGNDTARVTDHYLPDDMAAYSAYVRGVVERFDADGVDDMPGLKAPVRYFEVDNEPDLKNSLAARNAPPGFDPTTFCLPAEYAQVLIASSAAIHEASPTAKVLNAGLYRPFAEQGVAWFRAMTAVPGALDAIDILSAHTYHDDLDGERLALGIRNERTFAPSKPIWVTETSLGTTDTIDAEAQGRMVVTFVVRAALEGADKLFWHTLSDPPPANAPRRAAMTGHSLFQMDEAGVRTPRPAADVYTHLARFLAAHDLNGCVPDGAGAVRLRDGTVLLYEGTRPVPVEGGSLRTGAALAAGQTASAPAFFR